jgi:hypothetical protein
MEFQRDIHQLSFNVAKKEKSEGAKSGEQEDEVPVSFD